METGGIYTPSGSYSHLYNGIQMALLTELPWYTFKPLLQLAHEQKQQNIFANEKVDMVR